MIQIVVEDFHQKIIGIEIFWPIIVTLYLSATHTRLCGSETISSFVLKGSFMFLLGFWVKKNSLLLLMLGMKVLELVLN